MRLECNWSAILDWSVVESSIGDWNVTSSDLLLVLVVFFVPPF